eukprot:TRINITY_DN29228_c0_g2_i1.p1 TRINITY_DN29228_c0_g2~~TRINITY_DN29228_c0_g2_i1.p1  ORF type:complete len:556 (-),score=131.23 TRINITY_DN29228_c0_g2_i1:21-1688(-)
MAACAFWAVAAASLLVSEAGTAATLEDADCVPEEMEVSLIQESIRMQRVSSAETAAMPMNLQQDELQQSTPVPLLSIAVVLGCCVCLLFTVFALSWLYREPDPSARHAAKVQEDEILDFMAGVPAFKKLSQSKRQALAACITCRRVKTGAAIITQGEPGHDMFFIRSGNVSVKMRDADDAGSKEEEIGSLRAGDHFGEVALVTEAPRNASVCAVDDVDVFVLSRHDYQRLDLKDTLSIELKHAKLTGGLLRTLQSTASMRVLLTLVGALAAYLALTVAAFSSLEGWEWMDCIYFGIVTLSGVGYGDYAPKTLTGRLFIVFLIILALVFVATAIGDFLQLLVALEIENEKERKSLFLADPEAVNIFDKEGQKKQLRLEFLTCLLGIAFVVGIASWISYLLLDDVKNWSDALYFSVVTLTTVGYGDITPHRQSSKWFVCALCLFGVPVFAMSLARVVEIVYGHGRASQMTAGISSITADHLLEMKEFMREMKEAGVCLSPDDQEDEKIKPFQFVCFMLTKNESTSLADIKAIMQNFKALDKDGSGDLDMNDLPPGSI